MSRIGITLPDGAANPYLLPAAIIAAGLDGIDRKLNPKERSENNSYTDPSDNGKRLPSNLLDALRYLESDTILTKYLGESFVNSYLKLRYQQWNQYSSHVSNWKIDNTLDC